MTSKDEQTSPTGDEINGLSGSARMNRGRSMSGRDDPTEGADFRIDLETGEAWLSGRPVDLAPQPSRLLVLLARNRGRLVTRERIREEIWRDAAIDIDTAINNAIREIRDALGDDASAPRFVETIPGRGYRLVADRRGGLAGTPGRRKEAAHVSVEQPGGSVSPGAMWRKTAPRIAVVVGFLLVVFFGLTTMLGRGDTRPTVTAAPTRVAVAGSVAEIAAEMLDSAVAEALGTLEEQGVRHLVWRGAMGYDLQADAIVRNGEPLDVDLLIDMNASLQGDSTRVGVAILGVAPTTELWSRAFLHRSDDLEGLVQRVTQRVVNEIERLSARR